MEYNNQFKYKTNKPKFIINYNEKKEFYYDLIQYELDQKMYYFGENFKNHYEVKLKLSAKMKFYVKNLLIHILLYFKMFLLRRKNTNLIWNSAYFNFDSKFNSLNFQCGSPPWNPRLKSNFFFDHKIYKLTNNINKKLRTYHANELIKDSFFLEIDTYRSIIKKYIIENRVVAVFLPHSIGFFEKIIISVFNELSRPTFTFNHGLPYYWKSCDNLTDYFVVWGNAVKKNYIDNGYPESKILVSGHPNFNYKNIENISLKFNLDNVLILTKSINGIPSYDEYTLRDRSNCIVYLNIIQHVLKSLGVTKARFRPHPSENISWYLKFIDKNFYIADTDELSVSLAKSTVVIGPTSTVFIESLLSGINYVVFEPTLDNGYSFDNFKIVPPFNNLDTRLKCANNMEMLYKILNEKIKVDSSIISDYCKSEFNIEMIIEIIKNSLIKNFG